MRYIGIESMNAFGGTAFLDVMKLAQHRQLEMSRFDNLLMHQKSVALPYEDPITFGVNAAKPIIDGLSDVEKNNIELLITCSESGIDFSKSMSTYIHKYLGLNRSCRLFEIKQACYSGTGGFQMAINFILSRTSPGAKALIVATDISRFIIDKNNFEQVEDWSYAEPSNGAGAVALLISESPHIYQVDIGANGYYGYEVMDTCRPEADGDAGDADLSLLSYLDCCEHAFLEYQKRVEGVDYRHSFDYLAFHTPFGGMVKGAHRTMMRKIAKAQPHEIEEDFQRRVVPGLNYCQRVGNIMGATIFLSLASTICNGHYPSPKRLGCFSYGSGCCSEFYSGMVTQEGAQTLKKFNIEKELNERYSLSMSEYDNLLIHSQCVKFGTRNTKLDLDIISGAKVSMNGKQRLVLKEIKEFHRKYQWIN
uniref:BryR n=1 Tax=Candidatus Endobugula sertula TaxID=62101 RepID=A2CLL9_9GAMM|nr:BryR [Candidatus Endobugula sertula]